MKHPGAASAALCHRDRIEAVRHLRFTVAVDPLLRYLGDLLLLALIDRFEGVPGCGGCARLYLDDATTSPRRATRSISFLPALKLRLRIVQPAPVR